MISSPDTKGGRGLRASRRPASREGRSKMAKWLVRVRQAGSRGSAAAPAISAICAALLVCVTAAPPRASDPSGGTASLLPDLKGWTKEGEPASYSPDDLFEYIDGAADAYLSYEFEELAAVSYDGGEKRSISIEVYRHRDLSNAFGIYSQERSLKGKFMAIGTEGYYETGVVNFFHGPYYVKVAGFNLGGDDEKILTDAARAVAARIGGDSRFPAVLECFPPGGRIDHSERYFARDILGHGFLRCAYTADYGSEGEATRVYIFEAGSPAELERMLGAYAQYTGGGTEAEALPDSSRSYRFAEPLRGSDGPMRLRAAGRYAWGLFTDDGGAADSLLGAVEKNLRERRLIE